MGLVTLSAGGSETRPACLGAGLSGADCPDGGRDESLVGAAMKRGTGLSQAEVARFGKSRGRAPEGERAPKKGARAAMNARMSGNACRRAEQNLPHAPIGAPPPL